MTVKLSSKGQVVLPRQARMRLQLRPGAKFVCRVEGSSIILTLKPSDRERPTLVLDPKTRLRVTKSPPGVKVSSEDVRAALADFPWGTYWMSMPAQGFHTCSITEAICLELARKNSMQLVTFDQGIPNSLYIGWIDEAARLLNNCFSSDAAEER